MDRSCWLAWLGRAALLATLLVSIGPGQVEVRAGELQAGPQRHEPPRVLDVCGESRTYTAVPQKAVSYDVNITEMFLFLGLADRLVGYGGVRPSKEIAPDLQPLLERIPNLSSQGLNLETLVASGADFVFGGWSYGFRPGGVTPELLARYGIASYVLTESCVRVRERVQVRLEDGLIDLRNLAAIFAVQAQVAARIDGLQASIDRLHEQMQGNRDWPRVFVYDSGQKIPYTAGRFAMPHAMIEAAGGRNIFDDLSSSWVPANWEDVIDRDPQWIVIIDYDTPDAQGKIDFLLQKKELAGVSAIRERNFLVMSYAEATPGPRNVRQAQRLAAALHPERQIDIDPAGRLAQQTASGQR